MKKEYIDKLLISRDELLKMESKEEAINFLMIETKCSEEESIRVYDYLVQIDLDKFNYDR